MSEPTIHLSDWVRDFLHELDPHLTPTADGYSEAAVLMASYVAGASESIIAHELSFDREFVDLVGNRLRNAKLWVGGRLSDAAKARWEGDDGGVAMLIDINVARGSMIIASYRDDGEPMYSLSPEGKRHVERLLSPPPTA